jgi:CheY-like chemotaxis protein
MPRSRHIVIIFESEDERQQLRQAITRTGWINVIDDVPSGMQAFRLFRQLALMGTPIDLLLVDDDLRRESGHDIIAAVREIPGYRELPVVVMAAALPSDPVRRRYYALGVLKVMVKPAGAEALVRIFTVFRTLISGGRSMPPGGPAWDADQAAALGEG